MNFTPLNLIHLLQIKLHVQTLFEIPKYFVRVFFTYQPKAVV
jgi:hypothetical protein